MNIISKNKLLSILDDCASGAITVEQLQDWVVLNYDPPATTVGQGELPHIADAMNIVMNEYEIVKIKHVKSEGFLFAIEFIQCEAENFEKAKHNFIHRGFND